MDLNDNQVYPVFMAVSECTFSPLRTQVHVSFDWRNESNG